MGPDGRGPLAVRERVFARSCRGVGLTADQRSPKPRVGVRIPPPLPTTPLQLGVQQVERFMVEEKKNWLVSTQDYVGELKNEMRKVSWPNRKQVESTTAVVIFAVFAFAAFFEVV